MLTPMKMQLLKDCPLTSDASYTNVLCANDPINGQPYVYRLGKIKSKFFLARYNVELDEWEKLKEAKIEARFMYLTLMSMFKGRFIAIIG